MDTVKRLAKELFEIRQETPCRCGGSHMICLNCHICRSEVPDQIVTDTTKLAHLIDHTLLKPDASHHDVKTLCREADEFGFYSVCVNPIFVDLAHFQVQNARVCSVAGFPFGASLPEVKRLEALRAIEQGAAEIDMVLNQSWLKAKHYNDVVFGIANIADTCHAHEVILKVILETCYLNRTEIIIACLLAKKAGADFVKTSTGFGSAGAKTEDVLLMREVVGPKLGVKASGGIRDRATAIAMVQAGANRIGASQSITIVSGE